MIGAPRRMIRAPFMALAGVGAAAHNAIERWAGVGVFLEPFLGRRATNVLWSATLPWSLITAARASERDRPMLAFTAGFSVAGATVHYVAWPWSLRGGIVPWLEEAEGLEPELLPIYNLSLLVWLTGGVGSLLLETRRVHLKYALAGLATAPLLSASAAHHFAWARRQAAIDPGRWSKSLLEPQPQSKRASRAARRGRCS
jgi:hypothetical protein